MYVLNSCLHMSKEVSLQTDRYFVYLYVEWYSGFPIGGSDN